MQTITAAALREVARAICKSATCEGMNCCQWPCNGGRRRDERGQPIRCNVEVGGYDDAANAAWDAIEQMHN
jgi:hypothetical protein